RRTGRITGSGGLAPIGGRDRGRALGRAESAPGRSERQTCSRVVHQARTARSGLLRHRTGRARSERPMTSPTEDPDLIEAAVAGDRRALDRLLRDHQPRVWSVCRRIAGNDADALDATQEALMAIVRGLPRFDGRSRFSTWV